MTTKPINSGIVRDIILLALRIWIGCLMINNGKYLFQMPYSEEQNKYFDSWLLKGQYFPFPLFLAYLTKGAEFFGGLLVLFGLFTRMGASLIGAVMLLTVVMVLIGKKAPDELLYIFNHDNVLNILLCFFIMVLIYSGGGKYNVKFLLGKIR